LYITTNRSTLTTLLENLLHPTVQAEKFDLASLVDLANSTYCVFSRSFPKLLSLGSEIGDQFSHIISGYEYVEFEHAAFNPINFYHTNTTRF